MSSFSPPVFCSAQPGRGDVEPPLVRHPPALGKRTVTIDLISVVKDGRYSLRLGENPDVGERIAVHDQDIGASALLERADVALPAECLCIAARRRLDRFHRAHPDEIDEEL